MRELAVLLAGLLALPLAAAPPDASVTPCDPPTIAVRKVALAPVETPDGLEAAGEASAAFTALVAAELKRGGIDTVVEPNVREIEMKVLRAEGGYYSPINGRLDAAKYAAIRAKTLEAIRAATGADALLHASILLEEVSYDRGRAKWRGASEAAAPMGSGIVPGFTLALALEDATGREICEGLGGIQLALKYSQWNNERKVVPREKLFKEAERNEAAVRTALAPLLSVLKAPLGAGGGGR